MTNRKFYNTNGNYLLKFKPEIERYISPRSVLQFAVVLPFYLPFRENTHVTYKIKANEVANFHFTSIKNVEKVYSGEFKELPFEMDNKLTRVEMTFCTQYKVNEKDLNETEDNEYLSGIFDLLLIKLNNVIDSYRIKQHDTQPYHITKEMLDPSILYRLCEGQYLQVICEGILNLSFNKLDKTRSIMSTDETRKVMDFIHVVGGKKNPFIYAVNLKLDAQRYFKRGYYQDCIITIQTSLESFFANLYKEFLICEGHQEQEASSKLNNMRFKNLIIHQFSKRIGGKFDIEDTQSIIGDWWNNTYNLRNKIVHEGYSPIYMETQVGLHSGLDVFPYVYQLLQSVEIKEKYASITRYIVG